MIYRGFLFPNCGKELPDSEMLRHVLDAPYFVEIAQSRHNREDGGWETTL